MISVGNGWSSKTQVGLGTSFDIQEGGVLNATEDTIEGVGLPPHSLLAYEENFADLKHSVVDNPCVRKSEYTD